MNNSMLAIEILLKNWFLIEEWCFNILIDLFII